MKKTTKITITISVLVIWLIIFPTFTFEDIFTTIPLMAFLGIRNYLIIATLTIIATGILMWFVIDGKNFREKLINGKKDISLYNYCKTRFKGKEFKECLERKNAI